MTHPAPKPTNTEDWLATGTGAGITQPSNTDKTNGFAVSEKPPASWFNWKWATDSTWFQYLADVFPYGQLLLGDAITSNLTDALKSRLRFGVASHTISQRTHLFEIGLPGLNYGVTCYAYTTDNLTYVVEFAFNATFDGTHWNRTTVATDDAALLQFGIGGGDVFLLLARKLSSAGDTWNDVIGTGGWADTVAKFGLTSSTVLANTTFKNDVTVIGALLASAYTAVTATFSNDLATVRDILAGRDLAAVRNLACGGTLNATGATTLGGTLSVAGTSTLAGVTATGNLQAAQLHSTADTIVDGNCTISGAISAATGIHTTEHLAAEKGYVGPGTDYAIWNGVLSGTSTGANLVRPRNGKVVRVVYLLSNDPAASQPVVIEVFKTTGATDTLLTSHTFNHGDAPVYVSAALGASYLAGDVITVRVHTGGTGGTQSAIDIMATVETQE